MSIPLFSGLSNEVATALSREVKPMIAVKEQAIMTEGESGREMFMLMKGEVEMSADGYRLGFLGEGAFFGENGAHSFIICWSVNTTVTRQLSSGGASCDLSCTINGTWQ